MKVIKNKVKKIKEKLCNKTDNKQVIVKKGLVIILGISLLTYIVILNTGIFTPGYSQPLIDWLHAPGGILFTITYLSLLLILILLTYSKTNKYIRKAMNKIASPLTSKYVHSYSSDNISKRTNRIKYLMWVIMILTPLVVFTFINQGNVQAWWNDNWQYRKKVTISNAGSQQTDYQVLINLNTSTLVSAGKMRSDCADVRLMDPNTNNPITYPYIVESCNTTSTNIWIKMDTVPTTDSIFYMYYGNNTASSSESDPNVVFIAYDNFNDGVIDSRWIQHGDNGPWSETGGYLRVTDTDNDAYSYMYFNTETRSNTDYFVIDSRMRFNSSSIWGSLLMFDNGSSSHHIDFNPTRYDDRGTTQAPEQPEVPTINNDGTWYTAKITYDGGTGTMTIFHNGTSAYVDTTSGSEGTSSGYFGVGSNYAAGSTDWDYIRVRKYASTEPSSALASEEIGPSPYAYWKFNEGYGQTAYDSSTSQFDVQLGATSGSESSDPSWQTNDDCFSEKCLYFDGSDDYVDTNKDLSWSTTDSFTMSAWVNIDSSGNHIIIGKGYTTDWEYRFYIDGSTPGFIYWDTGGSGDLSMASSKAISLNTWHHVAATYNGSVGYIYVDGEQTGSDSSITGPFQNRAVDTKIGEGYWNSSVGDRFTGKIDDVKIYKYARSADEIKTDYISGEASHGSSAVLGRTENQKLLDGLVNYWKMDETSANTCDDTNDACDSSGNLNHARWEDNASSTGGKFASAVNFDGTNDRVATSSANGVPGGSGTAADWFHINWNARRKITFDNSDSTEDLDEFPVLIKLDSTRIDYSKTQDSGQDIRFTDSNGTTQLAHEIEKWDEAGTSWVWVKVPEIPSTSTTDYIWMYYDNPHVADGQDITNVWNDNYVAVLHTDETSGTVLYDSTSWGSNGNKKAATEPNPNSSGKVDGTQYFDGSNDYVDLGHPDQLDFTTGLTASIWIYPQDTTSQWDRVLHKPWTSDADPWNTWAIQRTASAQTYYFGVTISGPSTRGANTTSSAPVNSSWTHLTGTYNGQVAKMYFNGNEEGSNDYGSQADILTNSLPLQFGRNYYNREYPQGRYDELRLSNIARTGEWVEAEYKTVMDTFVSSYSGEERQSNPITIAAWVKADTLGATDRVIIARNSSGSYSWAIYNDSSNPGQLAFTSDGESNTGLSDTVLSTGIWYHVAMTVGKDTTRLYINGSLDKEITHNNTLPGIGDISAGADPDGTDGWDGKIDEVRIYNRTLPANEITQLYNWAPSPIVHYPFDEGTGTTNVFDRSGNENNGTMNGSMTEDDWVQGRIGKALDFDGTNDYVDADSVADTYDDFTFGGWFYINNKGSEHFLFRMTNDETNTRRIQISENGGTLTADIRASAGGTIYSATTTDFSYDTWHYISFLRDNDTIKLYIDGLQKDTTTAVSTSLVVDQWFFVGANTYVGPSFGDPGSNHFDGIIDEFKVYNYARTPEQTIEDMNAGHPAPGSPVGSPIMHWGFDEGYGDTANDSSPQNQNGNLGGGSSCPGAAACPSWNNWGKYGKTLDFDGDSDYVRSTSGIYDNLSEITISAWVRADTKGDYERVINKGQGGIGAANYSYFMLFNNDADQKIYCEISNGTSAVATFSNGAFPTGQYKHVVCTYDGQYSKIYIDGELQDDIDSLTGTINNVDDTVRPFCVGAHCYSTTSTDAFFDGRIDEVKFYNIALNNSQIKTEFNQGKSVVWGATSTDSSGNADRSSERKYCVPGDSTSCSSPVAEWKFDEGSGTSAYDTTQNNNIGTITNGPLWKSLGECKFGKCLQYDNSDDFVRIPNNDSTLRFTGNGSIEAWVKSNTGGTIFSKQNDNGGDAEWGMRFFVGASGYPQFYIVHTDGGAHQHDLVSTTQITTNEWNHVTAVWESPNMKIYINGKETDSNNVGTGTLRTGTDNDSSIGAYNIDDTRGNEFDGALDTIRVYDYALSQAQVSWNYNQGKPLGHWKLNECQNTTAYDSGSGGNNITITIGGSGDNQSTGTCSSGTGTEAWNNGTNGKINASLDFDGNDDYAITGANVLDETSAWTISSWVHIDTLPASPERSAIAGHATAGTSAAQWSSILGIDANGKTSGYFWDGTANFTTGTTTLSTGQWYHLVFTADTDSDNYYVYINGKDDTASDPGAQGAPSANVNEFAIGFTTTNSAASDFEDRFDGQIDEVKVFNYALTEHQVEILHNEGAVHFND